MINWSGYVAKHVLPYELQSELRLIGSFLFSQSPLNKFICNTFDRYKIVQAQNWNWKKKLVVLLVKTCWQIWYSSFECVYVFVLLCAHARVWLWLHIHLCLFIRTEVRVVPHLRGLTATLWWRGCIGLKPISGATSVQCTGRCLSPDEILLYVLLHHCYILFVCFGWVKWKPVCQTAFLILYILYIFFKISFWG